MNDLYNYLDTKYPKHGGHKPFDQIMKGFIKFEHRQYEISKAYNVSISTAANWMKRAKSMDGIQAPL